MGFLNPLNLLYLLSIAAVVAIYLRSRSRPTLEVSSLLLFEEQAAPAANFRRIRLDAMFWLEVLMLLMLSLAVAGLYYRAARPPEHVRRHVLIFDQAASMGAREGSRTRMELARREAAALIASAAAGDQWSVISYALDADLVRPPTADLRLVTAAIGALPVYAVATHPAALTAALLRARDADAIELFADRLPGAAVPAGLGDRLHFHPIGTNRGNAAIVSLDPGEVGLSEGHCVVRNFSARPRLCQLSIERDGQEVARPLMMVPPGGEQVAGFGPLISGGLIRARIVTPDALDADNQRYAYAPQAHAARALVVSPDAEVRDDLARVLLAVDQNLAVTAVDPQHLKAALARDPGPPALAVIHDSDAGAVASDARLLIFPASAREVVVGPTVPVSALTSRRGKGPLEHPVILGPARVLGLPDWMEVIADGGGPSGRELRLGAVGRNAQGRLGVIAFDVRNHLLLDPDKLDALIVTIDLARALTLPSGIQIVATGAPVSVPVTPETEVVRPGDIRIKLAADRAGMGHLQALWAGSYQVVSAAHTETILANYYDATESDLTVDAPPRPGARSSPSGVIVPGQVQLLAVALIVIAFTALLGESALLAWRGWPRGWRHV